MYNRDREISRWFGQTEKRNFRISIIYPNYLRLPLLLQTEFDEIGTITKDEKLRYDRRIRTPFVLCTIGPFQSRKM